MSNQANIANRRIILNADQLNSYQPQSTNLVNTELGRREIQQEAAPYLSDVDENENCLLGYN